MGNPDISDVVERKKIIDEIKGAENVARKRNEQRKFDIYRRRQAPYVLEKLNDEFDIKTVKEMRKILSINPCKRIVDEQASLYVEEPVRSWVGASDEQKDQLDELYKCGRVNPQMRLANRYYKLHGQTALYVLPKDGKIVVRALTPKDYDVIPDADDPEKAFAYVLNVFNKNLFKTTPAPTAESNSAPGYSYNDNRNQQIADQNDDKAKGERYVFWTDERHLTCDGTGEIVDGMDDVNPIEKLPFVDIANEKDFNFFVQLGSDVAEFTIDLLTQLSDLANTVRFQNYSQAIVYSVNQPTNLNVGPTKVLWLQVDPNADQGTRPEFNFVSPTPDIMGSLEMINVELKMFLSSVGLNPGTVSGKNEVEKFTSGIDHLLSNLDKFRASKEDVDIFRYAEQEVFELMVAWFDYVYPLTDENALEDDLKIATITDDVTLDMAFNEPHAVMTQTETEESCIGLMEAGLMTKLEAIQRIYDVDEEKAEEILEDLNQEKQDNLDKGLGPNGQPLPPALDPATGLPVLQPIKALDKNPAAAAKLGPDGKPVAAPAVPAKPAAAVPPVDPKAKGKPAIKGKKPFPPKAGK